MLTCIRGTGTYKIKHALIKGSAQKELIERSVLYVWKEHARSLNHNPKENLVNKFYTMNTGFPVYNCLKHVYIVQKFGFTQLLYIVYNLHNIIHCIKKCTLYTNCLKPNFCTMYTFLIIQFVNNCTISPRAMDKYKMQV